MPFHCTICGEESTRICVWCTKDACGNHLCAKCARCSDCCECDVPLDEVVHASPPLHEPEPVPEPPPLEEPDPVHEPPPPVHEPPIGEPSPPVEEPTPVESKPIEPELQA
jgi:hypothetical protein